MRCLLENGEPLAPRYRPRSRRPSIGREAGGEVQVESSIIIRHLVTNSLGALMCTEAQPEILKAKICLQWIAPSVSSGRWPVSSFTLISKTHCFHFFAVLSTLLYIALNGLLRLSIVDGCFDPGCN